MANIIRAGNFTDGGGRLVVVKSGNNADPVPSDPTQIIFNSDWGEMLPTDTAHIGTAPLNASSSYQTISFPSLGYVPYAIVAFSPNAYSSGDISDGYAFNNIGNYFTAQNMFAGGPPTAVSHGGVDTGGTGMLYYEIADGSLRLAYNPPSGYGFPTQIKVAWCVFRSNSSLTGLPTSRSGTNWMRWTNAGVTVAKPGKNVSSSNLDDFLLNPGLINTQPFSGGTGIVTSLPYAGTFPGDGSNGTIWQYTITHGLGYIPLFFAQQALTALQNPDVTVMVTTTQFIIYAGTVTETVTTALSIYPLAFSVFRQRWV